MAKSRAAAKAVSKAISRASGKACGKASVIALAVLLIGALGLALMAVFMPQVSAEHYSAPGGASVQLLHAKWCGHCKTLLKGGGEWEKLQRGMPGIKFSVLDEGTLKGKAAVKKFDVSGFPDIRIITVSGDTLSTYSGQRTEPAMRDWILQNIPSKVAKK